MFRSEKPYDGQNAGCTAKSCESRDYGCSVYGTKFRVYSAQAGGRCAKGELKPKMTKKQRSVSLCDHFKRSYGDRCKRKEDIVQGSDKKRRCAFDPFRLPKRKIRHCGACKTPLFCSGKAFYFGRPHCLRERCSGGLLREKHGRDSFKK